MTNDCKLPKLARAGTVANCDQVSCLSAPRPDLGSPRFASVCHCGVRETSEIRSAGVCLCGDPRCLYSHPRTKFECWDAIGVTPAARGAGPNESVAHYFEIASVRHEGARETSEVLR